MKNHSGFVPASSPIQPVTYIMARGAWCAVFVDKDSRQTHLQLVTGEWSSAEGAEARSFKVFQVADWIFEGFREKARGCPDNGFASLDDALALVGRLVSRKEVTPCLA